VDGTSMRRHASSRSSPSSPSSPSSLPAVARQDSRSAAAVPKAVTSLQQLAAKHAFRKPGSRGNGCSGTVLPPLVSPKRSSKSFGKEANARSRESHGEQAKEASTAVGSGPVAPEGDLCAICIQSLDDGGFFFPCGQEHRLHYACALHFLGRSLSMPSCDGVAGPLQGRWTANIRPGWRAIGLIEDCLKDATPQTVGRVICPLCRGDWPEEEKTPLATIMAQLRELSSKEQAGSASKMKEALVRIWNKFDHGVSVQQWRMFKALSALDRNLHTVTSFMHLVEESCDGVSAIILSFLRFEHVSCFSQVSSVGNKICMCAGKLRAPFARAATVRSIVSHIWATDVVSIEVVASSSSGSMRNSFTTTAADALAFDTWIRAAWRLQELTLHGLQWERIDPGGWRLQSCVANKSLRVLHLSHNCLLDPSVVRLADAMLRSPQTTKFLEVLVLDLNYITAKGLAAVLPLGKAANGIHTWGFRHNKLGDAGCGFIAEAKPKLASWDLRTNGLTAQGCFSLATVLDDMVELRLGCNRLGDAGVAHLAEGIGNKLTLLDLRHACCGEDGSQILGRALCSATSLAQLLLSGNEIGALGAESLAEGWRWLRSLQHVDLSSNNLGNDGVSRLAFQLPFWKQSPFRLSLVSVGCGIVGMAKLRAALEAHPRYDWQWTIELQNNTDGGGTDDVHQIKRLLDKFLVLEEPGSRACSKESSALACVARAFSKGSSFVGASRGTNVLRS